MAQECQAWDREKEFPNHTCIVSEYRKTAASMKILRRYTGCQCVFSDKRLHATFVNDNQIGHRMNHHQTHTIKAAQAVKTLGLFIASHLENASKNSSLNNKTHSRPKRSHVAKWKFKAKGYLVASVVQLRCKLIALQNVWDGFLIVSAEGGLPITNLLVKPATAKQSSHLNC